MIKYKLNPKIQQRLFSFSMIASLSVIALFYALNNYLWLKQSFPIPVSGQEGFHLKYLMEMEKSPLFNIIGSDGRADPLYLFFAVLINAGERSFIATKMLNICYFMILLVALYNLGKHLKDRQTGLFATIVISFFPAVYGSSRMFCEEFALMGFVTMSILFLFKSDYFRNVRYCLLFGLSSGIGVMFKYPFILFVIGPAIYILFESWARYPTERKKILLNLTLSLLIFLLIIFPRYRHLDIIRDKMFVDPFCEAANFPIFTALRTYTWGIINSQITVPFSLLFLFSFLFFLKNTIKKIKVPVLLWIFIPLIFISSMPHTKLARFFIPSLPAFALVSALGVSTIKKRVVKITLIFLIFLFGLIQYYSFSFGIEDYSKKPNSFYATDRICYKPLMGKIFDEVIPYVNKKSSCFDGQLFLMLPSDYGYNLYCNEEVWRSFFWFNNREIAFEAVVLKNDNNFFPELITSLKKANFVLYLGKLDNLMSGLFFDEQIGKQKIFYRDHHFWLRLKDFEYYLQGNYPECKNKILKELTAFKVVKYFDGGADYKIYLLERK